MLRVGRVVVERMLRVLSDLGVGMRLRERVLGETVVVHICQCKGILLDIYFLIWLM